MRGCLTVRPGLYFVEEVKNVLSLPGKEPRLLGRPTRGMVTVPTEISWLQRRCGIGIRSLNIYNKFVLQRLW